jgi:hypothetical protein
MLIDALAAQIDINLLVQMARHGAIERRHCRICAERVPTASSAQPAVSVVLCRRAG